MGVTPSIFLEVDGKKLTVAEAARHAGVPPKTIRDRLRLGWSHERALRPVHIKKAALEARAANG